MPRVQTTDNHTIVTYLVFPNVYLIVNVPLQCSFKLSLQPDSRNLILSNSFNLGNNKGGQSLTTPTNYIPFFLSTFL